MFGFKDLFILLGNAYSYCLFRHTTSVPKLNDGNPSETESTIFRLISCLSTEKFM
jgi:hypothetical protein